MFVEIALTVVWAVLCVGGVAVQLYRERHHPPFPPRPRHSLTNTDSYLRRLLASHRRGDETRPLTGDDTDTSPSPRLGQYGACQQLNMPS